MRIAIALIFALLSACGDQRPAAPSAAESARLDETDALLDNMAANEEGPADRSASPSNRSD